MNTIKEEIKGIETCNPRKILELAKPLMKYLSENHCPYVMVEVDYTTVRILNAIGSVSTDEFVQD